MNRFWTRTGFWAACAVVFCGLAAGRIGMPVRFSLGSPDPLTAGKPVRVYVQVQAAADIPAAHFEVENSSDWQILDGTSEWTGNLAKDGVVNFEFRVVPLKSNPRRLRASLRTPGQPPRFTSLDPERLGGKTPERAEQHQPAAEHDENRPGLTDDSNVPAPLAASLPQVPGQPDSAQPQPVPPAPPKKKNSVGIVATYTAIGRFVVEDMRGDLRGVRNATVELWNQNPAPSLGDELCARTITDGDGNYTIVGSCSDPFDFPDLFVRIVLNNTVVEVKPDSVFAGSYTFQTTVRQNVAPGSVNFGSVTVSSRNAFLAHNLIMRASQFMASKASETIPKVTVLYPAEHTLYTPFFRSLSIENQRPLGEVADIFHEYGHHILVTRAESPDPEYSNGNCDEPDPGHCIWKPELGIISWTEGWPDFFGALMHKTFHDSDGYGDTTKYDFQASRDETDLSGDAAMDRIEGVIAAILWDLIDDEDNDMFLAGAGHRDNFSMPFSAMWNVIRNYDPSSDLFHNHPTSIHEFWDGLRLFRLNNINEISEVYAEHRIIKPRPDLVISALQGPQAAAPGQTIPVSNTARNRGSERTNSVSLVRFHLLSAGAAQSVVLGLRSVPANLLPGTTNGETTSITIPSRTPLGSYQLLVCADAPNRVPESDEGNNCSSVPLTVR